MNPVRKRRLIITLVIVAAVGIATAISVFALQQSMTYLYSPSEVDAGKAPADGVFRLWGAPVVVTSRVPDTTGATPTGRAALVDMSQVAVARDLAPSVKLLTERYADYDQQAIRVVARYDAAPLNPKAIVVLTGITRS